MLNLISDFVKDYLPKHRASPSGWTSFNCPCCIYNGESHDTKGRGGIHFNVDGSFSFHCFNCKFKTNYQPGRHLNFKTRKLLQWLGVNDGDIQRMVIEAIRIKDLVDPTTIVEKIDEKIEFKKRALPENAQSIQAMITFLELCDYDMLDQQVADAILYLDARKIDFEHKYDFYLSEDTAHKLDKRIIIPCYWENELIGYTSRAIVDDVKPKYYSNYEPNYVFNTDMQRVESKIVIVCEGPFDAMSIDGVAILGNAVSEQQAEIIDRIGKEVIVVADSDKAGATLINAALKYGWNVSFPVWQETCKDINYAVMQYGKLFVVATIIDATVRNKFKIELLKRTYYKR